MFLICDAPGHGNEICDFVDRFPDYPDGVPDGHCIKQQMKSFNEKNIKFTIFKVNDKCDKMIKVMEDSYNSARNKLIVEDLEKASESKNLEKMSQSGGIAFSRSLE